MELARAATTHATPQLVEDRVNEVDSFYTTTDVQAALAFLKNTTSYIYRRPIGSAPNIRAFGWISLNRRMANFGIRSIAMAIP